MKTLCFTGHRPKGLPWGFAEEDIGCSFFKMHVNNYLRYFIRKDYKHFICGMAMGFDLIAAEIVIRLKKEYDITLEAAIPCKNQTKKWSQEYINRYNNILQNCDKITYVGNIYTKYCMRKRNQYMVDNSDLVFAVWNGDPKSGTAQTMIYSKKQQKKLFVLRLI